MNTKERIFHSVLFEAIALILVITAAFAFTDAGAKSATGLGLGLSLLAMSWNYAYNLGFDRTFGENRIERTFKMRLGHGLGFELGLIFVTQPFMMWMLQLDFGTVFIMNIGVVIFFLIYAIVYNWCYDIIRARIVSGRSSANNATTS